MLGEYVNGRPTPDNPYVSVSKYQTTRLLELSSRLAARLAENPLTFAVEPGTEEARKEANDVAQVLMAWHADEEERTRTNLQSAVGMFQARDCYAVLHCRLNPDAWQDVDGDDPEKTVRMRAKEGSPWLRELIDPVNFAFEGDLTGRGLKWASVTYEVSKDIYVAALEGKNKKATPTEVSQLLPAPGLENASDETGERLHDTPSSVDYENRVTLVRFWTRDSWVEFIRDGSEVEVTDKGENPYNCVPFWIVPAVETYQADPLLNYLPYLEPVYRWKPYWDRAMTLVAAIYELTAEPLMIRKQTQPGMSMILPDGKPGQDSDNSALSETMAPGDSLQQVRMTLEQGMADVFRQIHDEMTRAEPAVGTVEIGKATAPWTARQMTTEANVGPKMLMGALLSAMTDMMQMRLDYHARHPEEEMVAYGREKPDELYKYGRRNRKKVVRVDPSKVDMSEFSVEANVNPMSQQEQLTIMQLYKELYQPGAGLMPLITASEWYKVGLQKPDPEDYAVQVRVENVVQPYLDGYAKAIAASKMGSVFVLGVNGEVLDSSGNPVSPGSAAERAGWQRAVPPSQTQMPGMPPLQSPDTVPIEAGLV